MEILHPFLRPKPTSGREWPEGLGPGGSATVNGGPPIEPAGGAKSPAPPGPHGSALASDGAPAARKNEVVWDDSGDENEDLVVLLEDILPLVPTRCLRAGLHDPELELRFHVDELCDSIARGRVSVLVSRLAQICPAVFEAPSCPMEDAAIRLPLQKLIEQLGFVEHGPQPKPAEPHAKAAFSVLAKPAVQVIWKTAEPVAAENQPSPRVLRPSAAFPEVIWKNEDVQPAEVAPPAAASPATVPLHFGTPENRLEIPGETPGPSSLKADAALVTGEALPGPGLLNGADESNGSPQPAGLNAATAQDRVLETAPVPEAQKEEPSSEDQVRSMLLAAGFDQEPASEGSAGANPAPAPTVVQSPVEIAASAASLAAEAPSAELEPAGLVPVEAAASPTSEVQESRQIISQTPPGSDGPAAEPAAVATEAVFRALLLAQSLPSPIMQDTASEKIESSLDPHPVAETAPAAAALMEPAPPTTAAEVAEMAEMAAAAAPLVPPLPLATPPPLAIPPPTLPIPWEEAALEKGAVSPDLHPVAETQPAPEALVEPAALPAEVGAAAAPLIPPLPLAASLPTLPVSPEEGALEKGAVSLDSYPVAETAPVGAALVEPAAPPPVSAEVVAAAASLIPALALAEASREPALAVELPKESAKIAEASPAEAKLEAAPPLLETTGMPEGSTLLPAAVSAPSPQAAAASEEIPVTPTAPVEAALDTMDAVAQPKSAPLAPPAPPLEHANAAYRPHPSLVPLEPVRMPIIRPPTPRPLVFVRGDGKVQPTEASTEAVKLGPASGPAATGVVLAKASGHDAQPVPAAPGAAMPFGRPMLQPPPLFGKAAIELAAPPPPPAAAAALSVMSEQAPEPVIPPLALPRFNQTAIQGVFLTDEVLDLPKIAALVTGLPGVEGCILLAGEEVGESGKWPQSLDAGRVRAICRQLLDRVGTLVEKVTPVRACTLYGDPVSLTFFTRAHLCFGVTHAARGFLPGVREKLVAVADGLAQESLMQAGDSGHALGSSAPVPYLPAGP